MVKRKQSAEPIQKQPGEMNPQDLLKEIQDKLRTNRTAMMSENMGYGTPTKGKSKAIRNKLNK
jgi:hypothetical protein